MDQHGKQSVEQKSGPNPLAGQHRIELSPKELEAILEHARPALSEAEFATLKAMVQTLMFLTRELEKKSVSIQRLRQLLFGAATETTAKVIEQILQRGGETPAADAGGQTPKEKPKGHGRNGAEDYTGTRRVRVPLATLHAGDPCPECAKGTVYASCQPGLIVRLTGQAPIGGTVYELEKVRCNLCGKVFSATAPEGVGEEKFDAESAAMIALLKYGTGLPFHRLEGLQDGLGIPLPAATQWEIVEETAGLLTPVLQEMIRLAAQGQVMHNDDTTMKVLTLGAAVATAEPATTAAESAATESVSSAGEPAAAAAATVASTKEPASSAADADRADPGPASGRRGVFTSGIVSKAAEHVISLFFTGHKHAGENLLDLLRQRSGELGPPIQMCDALSRNVPKALQTILANCLAHARRRFVDVAGSFPDECLHVLEILRDVYGNDAIARERGLSPQERLRLHQEQSGPRMAELQAWMEAQIEQRKVEPNSGLGEAIAYMRKHWKKLTLFLQVPGAPLDNNVCERALKKAILHRKNAYFYLTENGASVGDLFMSLIHTCELNDANPFHYLAELQKHAGELAAAPADWMPWNYLRTLESAQAPPSG
jgi:transposase